MKESNPTHVDFFQRGAYPDQSMTVPHWQTLNDADMQRLGMLISQCGVNVPDIAAFLTRIQSAREDTVVPVDINGGFDKPRYAFSFTTESTRHAANTICQVYSGYTEPTDTITPETKLYFNRHLRYAITTRNIPFGSESFVCSDTSDHIMAGNIVNHARPPRTWLNRPEEVFSHMGMMNSFGRHLGKHPEVVDMRGLVTRPTLAAMENDSPLGFVEQVLNGFVKGSGELNPSSVDIEGLGRSEVYHTALSLTRSRTLESSPFLEQVSMKTDYVYEGFITVGELLSLLGLDMDHIQVKPLSERAIQTPMTGLRGIDDTNEGRLAGRIIRTVSGLLPSCGCKRVGFTWDRRGMVVERMSIAMPENTVTHVHAALQRQIGKHLRPLLVNHPNIELKVVVDLDDDAIVSLTEFEDMHHSTFVQPLFCSARFSPQWLSGNIKPDMPSDFFEQIFNQLSHYF